MDLIFDKEGWDKALNAITDYDVYHTYEYHQLSKSKGDIPLLLKFTDNDKHIVFPLIKRPIENTKYFDITSAYGYVGPIGNSITTEFDNTSFKNKLECFFKEEKIVSVFSRLNPFINYQETVLNSLGTVTTLGDVVNIDITKPLEVQRQEFSKTTKRYINKCKNRFDLKFSKSKEDILKFIELYYENMDRVNAKNDYYFSEAYFFDIVKKLDAHVDVLFAIDKENGAVACAAMMLKTNRVIQYHVSGTHGDYLNLSPIRLVIDAMRIRGKAEGFQFYNLGGGLGSKADDLFRFKASFSKDFKPFKVWKYISNQNVYDELVTRNKKEESKTEYFPLYRVEG